MAIGLIGIYLDQVRGFERQNADKMIQLTRIVNSMGALRVAIGDWNNAPVELSRALWLEALSGELPAPTQRDAA